MSAILFESRKSAIFDRPTRRDELVAGLEELSNTVEIVQDTRDSSISFPFRLEFRIAKGVASREREKDAEISGLDYRKSIKVRFPKDRKKFVVIPGPFTRRIERE